MREVKLNGSIKTGLSITMPAHPREGSFNNTIRITAEETTSSLYAGFIAIEQYQALDVQIQMTGDVVEDDSEVIIGKTITPPTVTLNLSGVHKKGFKDTATYVSAGHSDITETPTVAVGLYKVPPGQNLFKVVADSSTETFDFISTLTYTWKYITPQNTVDSDDNTIKIPNHALATGIGPGTVVTYSPGGGSPIGTTISPGYLQSNVDYYVIVVDSSTIRLATSLLKAQLNEPIDFTNSGNNNQSFTVTGTTYTVTYDFHHNVTPGLDGVKAAVQNYKYA